MKKYIVILLSLAFPFFVLGSQNLNQGQTFADVLYSPNFLGSDFDSTFLNKDGSVGTGYRWAPSGAIAITQFSGVDAIIDIDDLQSTYGDLNPQNGANLQNFYLYTTVLACSTTPDFNTPCSGGQYNPDGILTRFNASAAYLPWGANDTWSYLESQVYEVSNYYRIIIVPYVASSSVTNNTSIPMWQNNYIQGTNLNLNTEYTQKVIDGELSTSQLPDVYVFWVSLMNLFGLYEVDTYHDNANFKPSFNLTLRVDDNAFDPQVQYQAYLDSVDDPNNNNNGVIINGSCDVINAQECGLTDVTCGAQKALCWAVIGDFQGNYASTSERFLNVRKDNIPLAYFYAVYDEYEVAQEMNSVPIYAPISRLNSSIVPNDITLIDLATIEDDIDPEIMTTLEEVEDWLATALYAGFALLLVMYFVNRYTA